MLYLADFSVLKPDVGLFFWSLLIFILFWTIMGRFAFKPIANALHKRENDIQDALDEAKKAKEEMSKMKSENEQLLNEARVERANMLKEAKDMSNRMINEAKDAAKVEANKIISNASLEIDQQKSKALEEIKQQAGSLAVAVAEQLLRKQLDNKEEQENLAQQLVKEINLS